MFDFWLAQVFNLYALEAASLFFVCVCPEIWELKTVFCHTLFSLIVLVISYFNSWWKMRLQSLYFFRITQQCSGSLTSDFPSLLLSGLHTCLFKLSLFSVLLLVSYHCSLKKLSAILFVCSSRCIFKSLDESKNPTTQKQNYLNFPGFSWICVKLMLHYVG